MEIEFGGNELEFGEFHRMFVNLWLYETSLLLIASLNRNDL